ncbi:hypothetical protein G4B88_017964 [Cannabis sativa]|uniref:Uncharacterized protein n=1 Tax=Cannabis sativa TaxID=3483 RepID=A0A7J6HIM3_CANSA|nr:hypothetical protein G4B88_017964 [Cannabis sativa]
MKFTRSSNTKKPSPSKSKHSTASSASSSGNNSSPTNTTPSLFLSSKADIFPSPFSSKYWKTLMICIEIGEPSALDPVTSSAQPDLDPPADTATPFVSTGPPSQGESGTAQEPTDHIQ